MRHTIHLEQGQKYFYLYLLAQPWIDLVTAYMIRHFSFPITLGIVARGLFLVIMVGYSIYYLDKEHQKKIKLYLLLVILFGLTYIGFKPDSWHLGYLKTELIYFFKYFYFPILLVALFGSYRFLHLRDDDLLKIFCINAFVMALGILLPYFTQSGADSYVGQEAFGTVGWFYAANEVGAILALLLPAGYFLLKENKVAIFTVATFTIILAMLLIGTKVALFSSLGIETLMILWFFWQRKKEYGLLLSVLTLIISLVLLPLLPATHNMQEAIKKNEYLRQVPVEEVVQVQESKSVSSSYRLINLLFSGRQVYLKQNLDIYASSSTLDQIFGIGFVNRASIDNVDIEKLIEIDLCDIFLRYGIVGSIVYCLPIIYFLYRTIRIVYQKKLLYHFKVYMSLIVIALGLGISLLAGHILGAPPVSSYLALYMVILGEHLYECTSSQA